MNHHAAVPTAPDPDSDPDSDPDPDPSGGPAHPAPDEPRPTRVLVVEDARTDADLMLRQLRASGLEVSARIVQEREPFVAALQEFEPDLVLADFRLPRFSGAEALALVRQRDPFLPVILVTGTLPEEQAITLLEAGLSNYVLKDRLLRLGPAAVSAMAQAADRRQAAHDRAALEASERRFRSVARASGDGLVVVDGRGCVTAWNPAAEAIFGYPPAHVLGRSALRLTADPARRILLRIWLRALRAAAPPAPVTLEVKGRRASGADFPAEVTLSCWDEGEIRFLSAQVRDVTTRKEEARLRQILSRTVDQTNTSVIITHLDGTIEYVNPAFERLTGYTLDEVRGQTPRILKSGRQSDTFYQELWAEIGAGRVWQRETVNRRKDGSEYPQRTTVFPLLSDAGQPDRYVGLGQDVTQERLLEAQLQQAQKMELLGQLAGGLAHDFNNLLTGIQANAQLIELDLEKRPEACREHLDDLVRSARRGGEIVRRLMGLARPQPEHVAPLDLRGAVEDALRTARRLLDPQVEVVQRHEGDAPLPVLLDEAGLYQAILNLVGNARDAMPEGGRLTLRTRPGFLEGENGRRVAAGVVEVSDTGSGIDARIRDRIFEPFVTTKEPGRGTGLGLSMVHRFLTRAGGDVTVQSAPGAGTT
ncbi:MAG: PAS domain S-box protein, partial [Longimicrobiales bacterium]|nr:PAS domain S-box protein [Longimicrobiales bacterium]